jgi:hypothetical protein
VHAVRHLLVTIGPLLTAGPSLIKATVETVRTRLDTTYLETLVTIERSGTAEPATNDEVKDLQEEVESLYSEILSVAQMSVNQQHLEPALKAIAAQSGQSMVKTDTSLHYVRQLCATHRFTLLIQNTNTSRRSTNVLSSFWIE